MSSIPKHLHRSSTYYPFHFATMTPPISHESSITLLSPVSHKNAVRRGSITLSAAATRKKTEPKEPSHFDFVQAKEPKVSYVEALRFFWWAIVVMISQLFNDIREGRNGFATIFTADLISHFFVRRTLVAVWLVVLYGL